MEEIARRIELRGQAFHNVLVIPEYKLSNHVILKSICHVKWFLGEESFSRGNIVNSIKDAPTFDDTKLASMVKHQKKFDDCMPY